MLTLLSTYLAKTDKATTLLTPLLQLETKVTVKLNTPPHTCQTPTLELPRIWSTPMPMSQELIHLKLETPPITMELQELELLPVTSEEQLLTKFMLHLQRSPLDTPQEDMPKLPLGIFIAI